MIKEQASVHIQRLIGKSCCFFTGMSSLLAWEYIFLLPAPQVPPDRPPELLFSVQAPLFPPEKDFPDEPEASLPELFPYGQQDLWRVQE